MKINSLYISVEGTSACKECSNTVLRHKLKQGSIYTLINKEILLSLAKQRVSNAVNLFSPMIYLIIMV